MASTSTSIGSAPPPPLPKESSVRRYKFLWPMILGVNLSVGVMVHQLMFFPPIIYVAYLFMRTKKKDVGAEAGEVSEVPNSSISSVAAISAAPVQPAVVHEPIPEDQQREILKWILEEKRKVKPKDHEEKKRIDEEKAILKQFIRAKSIPSL